MVEIFTTKIETLRHTSPKKFSLSTIIQSSAVLTWSTISWYYIKLLQWQQQDIKTRTNRTLAFWGYPPLPHDYPLLNTVVSQVMTYWRYHSPAQTSVTWSFIFIYKTVIWYNTQCGISSGDTLEISQSSSNQPVSHGPSYSYTKLSYDITHNVLLNTVVSQVVTHWRYHSPAQTNQCHMVLHIHIQNCHMI